MSTLLSPPERPGATGPAVPPAAPGAFARWSVRWRLALRMARREARRARGRTALVLLMVGLPVAAVTAGDTLYRTWDVSAAEALPSQLGAADARIEGRFRGPVYADPVTGEAFEIADAEPDPWTAEEVRAALPAGSRVVTREVGRTSYRTGAGYATVDAFADDLRDPVRAGAFTVVAGRVPAQDGEVAVSATVAERGVAVGDRLLLTRDDVPATVVGVLTTVARSSSPFVVLPPASRDLVSDPVSEFHAVVPGGLDWPAVRELNQQGLVVLSRAVAQDPPPASETSPPGYWTGSSTNTGQVAVLALVVAALLLEVVLLAGPAFAVGLRRQRRDLALLAATGATPADLSRTVLAFGLLLGGGAAVGGALLGVGVAQLAVPVVEARTDAVFGPFDVPLGHVLVVLVMGTVAGLAAAGTAAVQASRTDVVTTLTGRRGQTRSSRRLPLLGLVLAVVGLVLTGLGARGSEFGVAGGAVLLVVGLVVATPWLVGLLTPLAPRLPTSARLAVRDAVRNRSRTAPAVAAVMATVAGVTTLAIGSASDSAQGRRDYAPQAPLGAAVVSGVDLDWEAVTATVAREVPGREVTRLSGVSWSDPAAPQLVVTAPGCAGSVDTCRWFDEAGVPVSLSLTDVLVGGPDTAARLFPTELAGEVAAALAQGRVAVLGTGAVDASRQVRLAAVRYDPVTGASQPAGAVTLPGAEVPLTAQDPVTLPAQVVVPESLVAELPAPVGPLQIVVGGPDAPVTAAEETRLREALTVLAGDVAVYVERGWSDELWVARLLLVLVGGTLVLVATLTATGLTVADARPDHATLAAVGAPPRTRRRMAMGSAAVIGGGGALLGVLAGLAPGIAVAYPLTSNDYGAGARPLVVVPWDLLAAVAVGVPLLAVLVTGLAVRSRLPMTTRLR
ncbi:FtsX-like permease family protein [Geodermatophilus sp. DSM 44513]|uniref:FtsX-like permease family protein n=1 Tax=Geodermatophilus sp. DSM 44513 TaxID=1528104 RepID=UPI001278BEC1|nr:FtsX-like permease family protein [Geodermatophilus sp. DSM 44513]WNV75523.1 FtsX-like permease family protein [Geodermatophilus sp. DSM 44513]